MISLNVTFLVQLFEWCQGSGNLLPPPPPPPQPSSLLPPSSPLPLHQQLLSHLQISKLNLVTHQGIVSKIWMEFRTRQDAGQNQYERWNLISTSILMIAHMLTFDSTHKGIQKCLKGFLLSSMTNHRKQMKRLQQEEALAISRMVSDHWPLWPFCYPKVTR